MRRGSEKFFLPAAIRFCLLSIYVMLESVVVVPVPNRLAFRSRILLCAIVQAVRCYLEIRLQ